MPKWMMASSNGIPHRHHFPGAVRRKAYTFDGKGNYAEREWDPLGEEEEEEVGGSGSGGQFFWYHVEIPKRDERLSLSAQHLIDSLCPPLKLQEILSLASNGPFCGHVGGALVFRVNSPGPPGSAFTLRLAARVSPRSVLTVSLGRVPRLAFSRPRDSLLSEVPAVHADDEGGHRRLETTPIEEHVLDFFLAVSESEQADDRPVPTTVANLVVHVVEAHVDHVQEVATRLEMELESVELELDKGGYVLKKQMLDERRFAKLHLDLQRLLQVAAHSEQVFPRVKEKCASKSWFSADDIAHLEEPIGRLRRIKENLGLIVNRVTAVQSSLDTWQAEQINRKLYYLSFLSMIFLPLSIITGIFGMNVGGVPWTGQKNTSSTNGFHNVLWICGATFFILLLAFSFKALYTRISGRRRRVSLKRSLSLNRSSSVRRSPSSCLFDKAHYIRL